MKLISRALCAVAAGLIGGASAQSDECTASTAAGFDFQVTPQDGFTIYWAVAAADQEITVQAVYEGQGYVSVGFSSTGAMVPGDAVIGLPDDAAAVEYDLADYTLPNVTPNGNPEISGATVTQGASATTLSFTRPLAPADAGKTTLSSEEGETVTFLWAFGNSNDLAYHGFAQKGSVTLSDLACSAELEEDDDEDEDGAEAAGEDCTSSDPDYQFEVAPSGDADELMLFWSVVGSSVSVKAVYAGDGWLGIGWSSNGRMPGSDSVIGLPDDATALEYDMDSYSTPVEAAEQEITDATVTQAGGVTTLTFVRPLAPSGDGKMVLSESDPSSWLYAWGRSNVFVQHSVDGSFSLSLDSCNVGSSGGGGTTDEYAHGWLMVLGWTFCFPVGILFARFSSSFKDVGFPVHRLLQTLGSVLVIAGFITAIVFTEDKGIDHFETSHGKAGLVLTIFVMLQVVAAVFRPSKPPAGAMVQDQSGGMKPEPPSIVRKAWSLLHRGLGYIVLIWTFFQCFGGLDQADAPDIWGVLYGLLAIAMATAFVVLQTLACFRAKRESSPVDYSGPLHGNTSARSGTRP